jgi:hypothetical protein
MESTNELVTAAEARAEGLSLDGVATIDALLSNSSMITYRRGGVLLTL